MTKTAIEPIKQPASKFSGLDVTKLTPFKKDTGRVDEDGNPVYESGFTDPQGNIIQSSTSIETEGGDLSPLIFKDPITTYSAPIKVGNQTFTGTYDANGNFQYGQGKEFYQNGHHWLPIVDAQGNVNYQNADPSGGIGDFIKMVAPLALGAIFPGAGTALGEALLGTGAAGASTLGGALIGAGTSAATGGDPIRGGLMGGIMPNLGAEIGDTGISIGQAVKGVQALQNKNPLALASLALSSATPSQTSGPSSADIEPGGFPVSGGEQYPQPFTVASSEDQPPASSSTSPLDSILPNAQKIIGGLGTAQKLINAAKSGPLGGISALTQFAKSNTPQASGDKLPTPRVDVSKLFPVSVNPPAYVPPSELIPLSNFESLNKLLTG